MKTLAHVRILISLLAIYAGVLWGAPAAVNPTGATLPAPTPYAVVSRDAHSRVWERIVYERGPSGQAIPSKHRYVELATGLNYWNNGQWQESKEEIEPFPGGAIARQGQHQIIFANNLATVGAIDMQTPDGKRMRSHVLGLSYFDTASGQSVLIAEVKDSQGQLYSPNVVIYPDAFTDFKADVRYTYTRAGFEQDIILHERPPGPEVYGLNPATTKLQVMTEFLNPPPPVKRQTSSKTRQGDALDEDLDFGTMRMGRGKAFLLERGGGDIPVSKQWLKLEGRDFLVEEVAVPDIDEELQALPAAKGASLNPAAGSLRHVVSKQRLLPVMPLVQAGTNEMQLARLSLPAQGLVLDYTILNSSQTDWAFSCDTTYYISGYVGLFGSSTFEAGTVIKYAPNVGITLQSTNLNWQASAYRPVIFTALDDNSVGESIGSGNPSGYYANIALSFNNGAHFPVLSNFRIAYANQAICAALVSSELVFYNAQFINCQGGIELYHSTANLNNTLFANVRTNFLLAGSGGAAAQNTTFNNATYLIVCLGGGGSGVTLTNCILANMTNLYLWSSVSGSYNGFYKSPVFGTSIFTNTFYPFQSAGLGNYYLTNGCNFFNAGTTNIDSTLLATLKTKTAHPPIVYSNVTISVPTTLGPQVQRDSDTPDLGYHYDPLDYIFNLTVVKSNLTFGAGTAAGWLTTAARTGSLIMTNTVTIAFNGTVAAQNYWVEGNTVQEGGAAWGANGGGMNGGGIASTLVNFTPGQFVQARFTRFSALGADIYFTSTILMSEVSCWMTNCEFYGGSMWSEIGCQTFDNCLFDRVSTWFNMNSQVPAMNLFNMGNCTMHGGSLNLNPGGGASSVITNCAFDYTAIPDNNVHSAANYNAYISGQQELQPYRTNCLEEITNFNWQSSWLGNYYLPPNSPLINRGSTNANLLGLYHYTTQTNQVKEANSIVDIGYHYVAADACGNPIDTNGDGIPDYLEDANGNGIYDAGDWGDWLISPFNGLTTANGLLVFTPLK